MSTSTQDISTAFNAATGLSNSAMMKMLAFGILFHRQCPDCTLGGRAKSGTQRR